MKRINNIFEKIYEIENLKLAHQNAQKNKKNYSEVKKINKNEEIYLAKLQQMLIEKTFKNSEYKIFKKIDKGKEREIYKLPYFPDRILHHAILQILEPIWKKTLIKNTYQSIKGRGIHKAMKNVKKSIDELKENRIYCLKMDVQKYYPSIDNQILKQVIRKKIKDKNILWLLDEIIDSTTGVPIGNYLSQYFGNLYLSEFDHWIMEIKKQKHYFRYCDDLVILSHNKDELHDLLKEIKTFLNEKLHLKLKSNYQIFPINKRKLDFLGFRFDEKNIFLRKSIAKSFKRKIIDVRKLKNPLNSIASYWGWFKYIDDKQLWNIQLENIQ